MSEDFEERLKDIVETFPDNKETVLIYYQLSRRFLLMFFFVILIMIISDLFIWYSLLDMRGYL